MITEERWREMDQHQGAELRANMEGERLEGPQREASRGNQLGEDSSPSGQGVLDGVGEGVAQV